MAQLLGTVIANQALANTNIEIYGRLYTQKIKRGRTHKIYSLFTQQAADRLIDEITRLGGLNARPVYGYNRYSDRKPIEGIRFEIL